MEHLGHIKLSKVQNRNKKMRQFEVVTVSLKLTGRWSKMKNSSQNRIYPSSAIFYPFFKGLSKEAQSPIDPDVGLHLTSPDPSKVPPRG